jgi:hypothetical protein
LGSIRHVPTRGGVVVGGGVVSGVAEGLAVGAAVVGCVAGAPPRLAQAGLDSTVTRHTAKIASRRGVVRARIIIAFLHIEVLAAANFQTGPQSVGA